jgi:hypothetical protein
MTLQQRFDAKWIPEPNSGCWLWLGSVQGEDGKQPRPRMWDGEKSDYAYRVSWKIHHGPVPDGMEICHSCDVTVCVNPDHLFVGTRSDNMVDCAAKGRTNKPKGVDAARTKLTEADVRMIRASDAPSKRLARELGVDDKTIRGVRTFTTWRHI